MLGGDKMTGRVTGVRGHDIAHKITFGCYQRRPITFKYM